MPDLTLRTGHDTYVLEASPANSGNAQSRFLKIRSGDELIPLFYMPVNATRLADKTITSAILSVPVEDNWVTQTVTIQALDADWKVARVNYGNKPGVTGPTANSGATGALDPGDRFEIDVTALVQNIADGDANYGWRLTTSQSTDASWIRGFDSGYSSFTLTVEFVDQPDAPTQLSPEGIIGINKPVVAVDNYNTLAEIQVQIDATPSATTPDYDTGWVATTRPKLDLSDTFPLGETLGVGDTTYNGLADGSTTYWRARVKLLNGGISLYSSWAEITRDDKPTIVMDNPSGTDIWDPTPDITAHLSPAGDADTRWQVIVAHVNDPSDVRYNSGDAIEGATLDHSIPLRNAKGVKVFPEDGAYRLEVRAWDRADRVPSQGDPTFARQTITVDLDVDGAVTAPAGFTATAQASSALYPGVLLHWTRASDPDWFVVRRDSEFLAIVDVDDYRFSAGVWEWTDYTAEPNVAHVYSVRAVTDVAGTNKSSASSGTATVTATVLGTWLRSDFGDVLINGLPEAAQIEKSQTFEMPYRAENVDIVTAVGGIEGTMAGGIDRRVTLTTTRAILEELRAAPKTDVRMVWGTHNIWVHLRGLSVTMSPESVLPSAPMYDVKFGFSEIAPRD